jgi:uncharacterized membrane protein YfcA
VHLVDAPWFYAVAVPAVLLIGLAKSGFAAGFGSLSTPLLALAVPAPKAAAILLPVLLVTDAVGLQRLWSERDAALLRRLLPGGLAGVALGTLLFGVLSPRAVSAIVGALTLGFLAQRLMFRPRPDAPRARWPGPACAAASGFTSFAAHAGAPPIHAYALSLSLPPLRFAGTMAVFFAAMNVSKIVPYAGMATGVKLLLDGLPWR